MTRPHRPRPDGKPVVRFAPSPTGYLHIGGARTALFNWAYARRHGGTFILRMEDTDVARSTAQSTRQIIEDLQWLGLDWDEGPDPDAADVYAPAGQRGDFGPYFQSQRGALYREHLDRLIAAGRAYRCFKTQEQIKAERETQKAAGRPMIYDPREALERSEAEQQRLIAAGTPFVWRFRMPDRDITVPDLVLGDVTIKAAELEDFVIMKSDQAGGGPTFHFANVVDDATMRVTHVLRAQEHLMNTPKHVALFEALGLPAPRYAHMPLIFNPDGTKMGKRDKAKTARQAAKAQAKTPEQKDALLNKVLARSESTDKLWDQPRRLTRQELEQFLDKKNDDPEIAGLFAEALGMRLPEISVHDFRESGYLKEVLLNYVALVGWSPGGNVERFDLDYLNREFDLERLGKSNAKFDRAKLLAFNAERLQAMPAEEFESRLRQHILEVRGRTGPWGKLVDGGQFSLFAKAYQPRSRTLSDPMTLGAFFATVSDKLEYDSKAVAKVVDAGVRKVLDQLEKLRDALGRLDEPWTPGEVHDALVNQAGQLKVPLGDLAQLLRLAVSGGTVSPPIHETLAILGKQSTVERIGRCFELAAL